ncbi:MAG TPA: lamin tail domain-containing protein [Myxococcaceae bacterium]|jgi:hypothetical protein
MLKRSWVQALCAAVCVLALAGCGGSECETPVDCRNELGNPPAGKEYTCVDNKCGTRDLPPVEEDCSPECAANEVCDTDVTPNVCRTCTATQGCTAPQVCDVAANGGKGQCKTCTDSATTGTDSGCTSAAPVCDPAGNNGLGVCKGCVDTASGNAVDLGCQASAPLCDQAANNGNGVCKACSDTAQGTAQDLGCGVTFPMCDPAAANGTGACKSCTDTAQGTGTDLGCAATAPICLTTASGGRGACRSCTDTAVGTGTDLGCVAATPLCDIAAGNGVGACKSCVDSAAGTGQDQGCSASAPVCDPAGNNGAGVCKNCVDSVSGTGTDSGCTAGAPICDQAASNGAGLCKACVDSANGGGTDVGCAAGAPVCDTMASAGVGACKVCVDSAGPGSGTQDDGCFSPTAICDEAASNGAGACKVCVTSEGCTAPQACNAAGTACEGCVDNASCASTPSTPFCKTTSTPSVCVECLASGQCTNPTRPVCSASSFCGCADDASCKSAPGNTDFCDKDANNRRGECKVCVTDANCAQLPNSTTPFCENQTACIQCRTTADCSLTQQCNTTTKSCEPVPGNVDPATTNTQITNFKALPAGTLNPPFLIEGAFVTYIKPAIGDPQSGDTAGFFLQALATGPALYVSADPGTLQVGDRITLSIGEKRTFSSGMQGGTTVTNVTTISRGHPVQNRSTATPAGLATDVTNATDLVTNVENYVGRLIYLTGTLAGPIGPGGSGHSAFDVRTGVITATPFPRLRLPTNFVTQYELVETCTFTLDVGVMWKFTTGGTNPTTTAQPSAYTRADFSALTCPAPRLVKARALSATEVQIAFDRTLDADTVQAADFTIAGISVTGVSVTGKEVVLTTTAQTASQAYTVTVAGEVKDVGGRDVDPAAKTFNFTGFTPPPAGPSLVLNELDIDNPNVDTGEYIEIFNRGGQAADLTNVVLLLVNGDAPAGTPTAPRKEYLRFALSAATDGTNPVTSLPAGGYLVAASAATLSALALPPGTLRITIARTASPTGQDIVQNGADGIGLMDDTTGTLLDSVYYRGGATNNGSGGPTFEIPYAGASQLKTLNFQEGTIALARDPATAATPTGTIGRLPNGNDTNINDSDFVIINTGTPGAANQPNP